MKLFNSTPDPTKLAKRELLQLDVEMLQYTKEMLRMQKHVEFIEARQVQLKEALGKGFYEIAVKREA